MFVQILNISKNVFSSILQKHLIWILLRFLKSTSILSWVDLPFWEYYLHLIVFGFWTKRTGLFTRGKNALEIFKRFVILLQERKFSNFILVLGLCVTCGKETFGKRFSYLLVPISPHLIIVIFILSEPSTHLMTQHFRIWKLLNPQRVRCSVFQFQNVTRK